MQIIERFGLSCRRGCQLIGLSRTSFTYRPVPHPDEDVIRERLKELAQTRRRFGCPRLHVMLRREGFMINHKRTERLYKQEGLSLRIRRRKKRASQLRVDVPGPGHPNHIWSANVFSDRCGYLHHWCSSRPNAGRNRSTGRTAGDDSSG